MSSFVWAQSGSQGVPPECEENLSCEGAGALAQAAHSGCGVPFSGGIQTRPDAVLCTLRWVTPLWQGAGRDHLQGSLPTLTSLGFSPVPILKISFLDSLFSPGE